MQCTCIHPSSDLAGLALASVLLPVGVADAARRGTEPPFLPRSTAVLIGPRASAESLEVNFFFNDASSCGAMHGSAHPTEAASQPGSITTVAMVPTVVQYG